MEPTCKPRFRQLSDYPIDAEAFKPLFGVHCQEFDVDSTMCVFFARILTALRYHVSQKGMTKNKRPPHESNKRLKRLLSQMDWNDFSTAAKGLQSDAGTPENHRITVIVCNPQTREAAVATAAGGGFWDSPFLLARFRGRGLRRPPRFYGCRTRGSSGRGDPLKRILPHHNASVSWLGVVDAWSVRSGRS